MINLVEATQDAVFAALNAAIDPALAPVRQHVPQGTQPPFIKVGQIDEDNQAAKGEQFEKLTVEVQCVFRGEERGPLLEMMHAVRLALDPQADPAPLAADGVAFGEVRFVTASAGDASVIDGLTYVGVSSFEIWAEPA